MNTTIANLLPLNPPAAPKSSASSAPSQTDNQSQFPTHLKRAHAKSSQAAAKSAPVAAQTGKSSKSGKAAGSSSARQTASQAATSSKPATQAKAPAQPTDAENENPQEENQENQPENAQETVAEEEAQAKAQTPVKADGPVEESNQAESSAPQHAAPTKPNTSAQQPAVPPVDEQSKWNGSKQRQQKNQNSDSKDDSTNPVVEVAAAPAVTPTTAPTAAPTAAIAGGIALDGGDSPAGTNARCSGVAVGKGAGHGSAGADVESDQSDNSQGNAAATAQNPVATSDSVQSTVGTNSKAVVTPVTPLTTQVSGLLTGDASPTKAPAVSSAGAAVATPEPPADTTAGANVAKIVTVIGGQLLPNGGTMQIRLDPPELGPLQVSVKVQNGVISATFETSTDDATKLLSHSLSQLKQSLEAQGIGVDRLHVQQSSRSENSGAKSDQRDGDGKQDAGDQQSSQREEQRREVLRRMWRRASGGRDPLDLVA